MSTPKKEKDFAGFRNVINKVVAERGPQSTSIEDQSSRDQMSKEGRDQIAFAIGRVLPAKLGLL